MKRRWVIASLMVLALGAGALAQLRGFDDWYGGGRGGLRYYDPPPREIFPGNTFTFCRVQYSEDRMRGRGAGRGSSGWMTDYPESDLNFSLRLSQLTTIRVNRTETGEIRHDIVRLDEPALFNYPFIYFVEAAAMSLTDAEREGLRSYLLRGGFALFDDFWGAAALDNVEWELNQVLPPDEYPIVDVPMDHEIFRIVFQIDEVPQIPAAGHYWRYLDYGITYEEGFDYRGDPSPSCRGIFDKNGRLMVVIMHNTDLGDGWEEESRNEGYFEDFSRKKAYPMGINIVVYAMTH